MLQVSIISKTCYVSGGVLGKTKSVFKDDKVAILDGDNVSKHIEGTRQKMCTYTKLREQYEEKKILCPEKEVKYDRRLRHIIKKEDGLCRVLRYLESLECGEQYNAKDFLEVGRSTFYNCCKMNDDFKMCRLIASNRTHTV